MKEQITKRVLNEANYILNTNNTIRTTAKEYQVSKSTVHKDISERLKKIDFELANNIDNIIKEHIDTRHIRGGEITKQKYKGKKL
jgi:putative DeoR family transcriptional regulator (stage III sporulation protein D)